MKDETPNESKDDKFAAQCFFEQYQIELFASVL
jgi:hypothetical protein